jgi:hypothetical protein
MPSVDVMTLSVHCHVPKHKSVSVGYAAAWNDVALSEKSDYEKVNVFGSILLLAVLVKVDAISAVSMLAPVLALNSKAIDE